MKKISYDRIYQSQEYLSPLGEIHHRALFGGYTLAVDEAVFAMVSDGELYLRACEQSAKYCVKNASSFLTQRHQRNRLKDLPNLTFQIEVLLMEAGITNEETLRQLGAKTSWLKMRSKNKALSIRVLFALEGAIEGLHEAALPADIRRELMEWFNALPESQGHHSAR